MDIETEEWIARGGEFFISEGGHCEALEGFMKWDVVLWRRRQNNITQVKVSTSFVY